MGVCVQTVNISMYWNIPDKNFTNRNFGGVDGPYGIPK